MGWTKREAVSNLVILGDGDEHATKAGGLLASIIPDRTYPERQNYELVQRDGESLWLAGSASIGRQIGQADVGKFAKFTFKGWGKSANGKFKDIEVLVYEEDPTPEMKAWPRWKELNAAPAAKKAAKPKKAEDGEPANPADAPDFADFPEGQAEDDDDLPF